MKRFREYKYKGLTLIAISILITIFFSGDESLNQNISDVSRSIPIFGSFIAGILYVSASTVVFGVLLLLGLSKTLSALEIATFAGLGAVVANFVLFRFFKGNLIGEITPIYNKLGGGHVTELMHHKYFRWSLPIVGAIIIASPFPDELGISLMGLTQIKTYQFVLLSLVLNITGIFLLVSAFSLFK
ncbi:MAG: hypothetical protein HYW62_04735 [Candidatus Levybacteria bacterium]|nr:hypothetical protein [Candidatus Levybacteria bacterium]